MALVVDRRLVVDEAHQRAKRIVEALQDPDSTSGRGSAVVREVARRLSRLAGKDAAPLVAARLRGGAPLENDWARTPTQPTILTSTVDQVGSRLLFRGYGVSDRMKPVHAGLLGSDSLILLDEAHLSEPFRQTLQAVRDIGGARIKTALLTATPGVEGARHLALTERDRAHPVLARRIGARKPATLRKVANADAFAEAALRMMRDFHAAGVEAPAVAVVVNRIAIARAVFDAIKEADSSRAQRMIGRSRDVDRRRIDASLAPFRTGASREGVEPLFVVATQCLEVGADLDFDGFVSQAASLDALRQRFGRLNRSGERTHCEGAVLALRDDLASRSDDPVYGDRIRATWEALQDITADGVVDFGSDALERTLQASGAEAAALSAPKADAPVVMPAYLDLWSHTSPVPAADPEVDLFLHGAEHSAPEVTLVWRGDIDAGDLQGEREDVLTTRLTLMRRARPRRWRSPSGPRGHGWLGAAGAAMSPTHRPGRSSRARIDVAVACSAGPGPMPPAPGSLTPRTSGRATWWWCRRSTAAATTMAGRRRRRRVSGTSRTRRQDRTEDAATRFG
ncbi:MAG TPA: type I-U CRISPR-associated helicase/endonuclease Cas3 [Thermoanaerobaculia bacterium]|nr:type I-U CRISPR-associated helicase/endonuclease Cas3 [Thermoanaerobaculia bacterium]